MTKIELGPFPEAVGYQRAADLDTADLLRGYRDRYVVAEPHLIYLDGNSLGRLPKAAIAQVDKTMRQWGDRLIRSWNEGWWNLQLELGDKLAPLLGANSGEVIISDSTSVNLFKLAASAMKAREGRARIITDDLNFPTDIYVLDGVARLFDADLIVVPSDGVNGPVHELVHEVDTRTGLLSLSHTTFKSGYTYDLTEVTAMAHDAGALVLWDMSHSAGVVPIDLAVAGVDLAIGCTYKYLNGGPGSPAFLYVRSDLQDRLENPITAWWGHAEPFSFDLEFLPVQGIRRFHTGTMPILSLAALEAGIEDVASAGITKIRDKSVELSTFLVDLVDEYLVPLGFSMTSPTDPGLRGSHVSVSHESAWPITRAMIELADVIPDFRAPDSIRLGLSPLYTSFVDVHTAVLRIKHLVENGAHHDFKDVDLTVT